MEKTIHPGEALFGDQGLVDLNLWWYRTERVVEKKYK
jgi:hypothetical protein